MLRPYVTREHREALKDAHDRRRRELVGVRQRSEYVASSRHRAAGPDGVHLELPVGIEHGTETSYNKYRCRCMGCRNGSRDRRRARRARAKGET